MEIDIILVTGKDGVTHVYFLMGIGYIRGLNGLLWCGKWDSTSPEYYYVDRNGKVHGPNVRYLGVLQEWAIPKFGKDIENGLARPTPKDRSPAPSPCYLPGKEPYPGREKPKK